MMEVHVTSTFPLHSTSAGPSGSSAEAGATEGSKPPPPSAKEEEVGKHLDQLVFPTALSPSVAEVLAAPEAASESPICAAATSPKEAAAQPSSGAAAVELVEPEEQAVKAVVAPPLAQCVPMVELYVQQGAQVCVCVRGGGGRRSSVYPYGGAVHAARSSGVCVCVWEGGRGGGEGGPYGGVVCAARSSGVCVCVRGGEELSVSLWWSCTCSKELRCVCVCEGGGGEEELSVSLWWSCTCSKELRFVCV